MSQSPVLPGDHVFLIDGSSYIFRAFHALPALTRKSDGMPIGAVAGFCNMLWKLMRDDAAGEKPTHLAVVFDHSSHTFRNDLYDQYKAQRSEPPEDLRPQFGLIRHAVRAFDLPCIEQQGFEADDLIATYARRAREKGATVIIVASDKDLMQLVGDGVVMLDPMKEKRIGPEEVREKFGVYPDRVVDVQALAGDSVDNVPGVPGIGIKTAAQLINEFGDLDTLLARAGEIKQVKRRESLIEHADKARLSRRLVLLDNAVPLTTPLEDLRLHEPDPKRLVAFLKAMEFTAVTRRVAEAYALDANAIDADPEYAVGGAGAARSADPALEHGPDMHVAAAPALTPHALAAARAAEPAQFDRAAYETIGATDRLDAWIAAAREAGQVAIDLRMSSSDPMQAEIIGIALCVGPGRACYLPLAHKQGGDLFDNGLADGQLDARAALARLKPLLEDASILKIAHDMKGAWLTLLEHGVEMRAIEDVLLISYVLDAGRAEHGLAELAQRHLKHAALAFGDVAGTGKNALGFARASLPRATEFSGECADIALRAWRLLKPRLPAERMSVVYEALERPMIEALGRMERRGIAIDRAILSRLSGEFAQTMARLEAEIFELAGGPFNLGSPKQIGDILFGKLGLPGGKKTSTGAWSTSASVLDELAEQGVALAGRMLDWRQVSKLKSTYTDALPGFVNARTGRVHTNFSLAATTTGRLSSSDPNVQNIPVRNEEGRKIRKAFIAQEGHKLLSADYSQIELRLLAHIADIPQLKHAFAEGLDIHAMTASEMFGVPVRDMPADVRRRAKAINFGIIYGISAFGLANQLSIPREEAGAYIRKYFERFPGIRDYMDATKKRCKADGYVTTIFGRKCHYPRINASNPSERAFNERAAINAPIQGSAADIIRRAMVRMDAALAAAKLEARMLLQVHDELVFEAPVSEIEATIAVVRRVMVDAPHPLAQLSVPLQVDARAAHNWDEAH